MFERFTDRARRVVVLAQEEARILNHDYIGTEHILLGLIREEEGIGAQALTALGASLDEMRARVVAIVGEGQARPIGQIPFAPRAKKVLELALREALQLGHNYIGTEHILLGLIREGEGVAAHAMRDVGIDLEAARREVLALVSRLAPEQAAAVARAAAGAAVEPSDEGDRTDDAESTAPEPRCPSCREPLEGSARVTQIQVEVDDEGAPATVRILSCRSCGSAIGIVA